MIDVSGDALITTIKIIFTNLIDWKIFRVLESSYNFSTKQIVQKDLSI
jgi:hypothetical protein